MKGQLGEYGIKIPKGGFFGSGSTKKDNRDERRSFNRTQKNQILYQQDNKCARCHKKLDPRATEFDHKKPWASGGRTITINGRALCADCHKIVTHEIRLKKVDKKRTHGKSGGSYLENLVNARPW